MHITTRGLGVAAAAMALLTGIAACGSSGSSDPLAGMTAKQIADKAEADLLAQPGVRFTGTVTQSGTTVSLSMLILKNRDCQGTFDLSGKGRFLLVYKSGQIWIKPDTAFWQAEGLPTALLPRVAGKYISEGGNSALGSFKTFCNLNFGHDNNRSARKIGTATVNGQRTMVLTSSDGSHAYISDTAIPEFLRVTGAGSATGSVDVTILSSPPAISPPPASEIVNPANLVG